MNQDYSSLQRPGDNEISVQYPCVKYVGINENGTEEILSYEKEPIEGNYVNFMFQRYRNVYYVEGLCIGENNPIFLENQNSSRVYQKIDGIVWPEGAIIVNGEIYSHQYPGQRTEEHY